jgi:hypothetical protein
MNIAWKTLMAIPSLGPMSHVVPEMIGPFQSWHFYVDRITNDDRLRNFNIGIHGKIKN